jgi:hypothetical protein
LEVVPTARREREDSEVRQSRGAEKGVEETGWDDGLKRSCVWRCVDRDVEYATEESA